jgi:phage terminase small subunit
LSETLDPNGPLTPREKRFVKKYVETGVVGQSARAAGFADPKYGTFLKRQPKIQTAIQEQLDRVGVTDEVIAQKIRDGLDAQYPEKRGKGGEIFQDASPDYFTRHKYLDTTLKVRGDYAPDRLEVTNRQIVIVISPAMAKGMIDSEVIDAEEVETLEEDGQRETQGPGVVAAPDPEQPVLSLPVCASDPGRPDPGL